ncbi:MAG TPA: hypothetical protein VGI93_05950 [Steroidobacteraceae bacterium]
MQKLQVLSLSLAIIGATASAAHLTQDPLTQLPLPAITDNPMVGNAPTEMPAAKICKSAFRGNFYALNNVPLDTAVAWYVGALKGFRHIQSADHSSHLFADAQRSIVVIVRGVGGNADSVAYEKYEPGLSEKALVGFVNKNLDCT